ncbi:MAG TPA: BtpA/SgcQ family protein [Candidatus Dormibacteraeota bacterium]|nr:BtpA/SgcQ family protein [Candidatus Dormibacteraeota bacterium]
MGVVGLPPLPGSPGWGGGGLAHLRDRALRDGEAYARAGFDALMLQNVGDLPVPERVGPETVAWMTAIGGALAAAVELPLGVSVLKNDGPAALAVAQAIGARFVRVKVWVGAMVGAEGLVQGCAREVLEYRRRIDAEHVAVWADVHDRTGVPLVPMPLEQAAREAVSFGRAEALVVTGGDPDETLDWAGRVRRAVPGTPVVVGGGARPDNVEAMLAQSDAVIVATSAKVGGQLHNPVDPVAAAALVEGARRAREAPVGRSG